MRSFADIPIAKKLVSGITAIQDRVLQFGQMLTDQQPFIRAIVVEFIQRVFDLTRRC